MLFLKRASWPVLIVAMLLVYRNKKKTRKGNIKEISSVAIEMESNPMHRKQKETPSVAIEMGSNSMHQKKKQLEKTTKTKKTTSTKKTKKEDPEQGNWSSHQSPEGKTYFHDQVSGRSTWTDKTSTEKANWSSHQTPEGATFFHDQVGGRTTWTDPSSL